MWSQLINHFSTTSQFSIAFDFLFRFSKHEIKSDGKVKSDFIGSWIKKQNLVDIFRICAMSVGNCTLDFWSTLSSVIGVDSLHITL